MPIYWRNILQFGEFSDCYCPELRLYMYIGSFYDLLVAFLSATPLAQSDK